MMVVMFQIFFLCMSNDVVEIQNEDDLVPKEDVKILKHNHGTKRKEYNAFLEIIDLPIGQRNLLNYISMFCRKYGVNTFSNDAGFRQKYIDYLRENNSPVNYTSQTINVYFNELYKRKLILRLDLSQRKYFKVREEFLEYLM